MSKTGIAVRFDADAFTLTYGSEVIGPPPETRYLSNIRKSLLDVNAAGPEKLYLISMDVYGKRDRATLLEAMLLYGIVAYSGGQIGSEPVRSQGHIHAPSLHSGWSPPELFEIWDGTAIIYMQERADDKPGRCFAIHAPAGARVIVPPGWAHMVINADPAHAMVFGAICDRGYNGFLYDAVRAHQGLAYYPTVDKSQSIAWSRNHNYAAIPDLVERGPRTYEEFGFSRSRRLPLYTEAVTTPERFRFVPYPQEAAQAWKEFEP